MTQKMLRKYPLDQSPLYKVRSKKKLAQILNCDKDTLMEFAENGEYKVWEETNSKGKTRIIENPTKKLKNIQKKISKFLDKIAKNDDLFCPVRGRSYVDNARRHIGSKEIVCLDIKNYFQETSDNRVFWFWSKCMKCPSDVAWILTRLSTYSGHLSTGSPVSPVLAYFAHMDMWERVSEICRDGGCCVSIYMDDLTISGQMIPRGLIWEVKKAIFSCGLRYHKEKFYSKGRAEITGVIVSPDGLSLPNRQKFKMHQARKRVSKNTSIEEKEELKRRMHGLSAQRRQVESSK